jgi:phenylalanyl-tRNA synthetase beta chain
MKFSKSWLKDITKLDIDTEKLIEQLTMVGLEVAAVKPVVPYFHSVIVGEILAVNPHPNADKLTVCTVNIGKGSDELTIVCGAKNVRPRLKVPVALIGAELPGDFKIKQAKLRGVESSGMLCAACELGLTELNPGILELPDDAPIGIDIRKYLFLDNEIFEIELTANRGDCLSILGIAREVAAINRTIFALPKAQEFPINKDTFPVVITAKDSCPHYCGRIIRGVNNRVATPTWMLERLRSINETSVSFVVDVTNYVMYELGQPLHAFDLAKLDKNIEVRYAKPHESIELLDSSKIDLKDKTLVIADGSKPVALAGIMGGIDSGISLDTQDIFLESAFFMPAKIAEQSRAYKLQTDASYRYERGVDYDLQLYALNRATSLIVEIAGGMPGAISEVVSKEYLPTSSNITLYRKNIQNILGISISDEEVTNILSYLGITLLPIVDGWQATIPSFRAFDIKIEEDLVEEIARIYGYHLISEQKIIAELGSNDAVSNVGDISRICNLMEDLGYHEVITYSFIDKKIQDLLGGEDMPLSLANPISSEQSIMRNTLWPGLVNVIKHNAKRQEKSVHLFEIGLKFVFGTNSKLEQIPVIFILSNGELSKREKQIFLI